jgi:type II secretory pathway pseudopilin PulG
MKIPILPGELRNSAVRQRQGAFTRAELVVVLAIVALLMVVLGPAVGGIREETSLARCNANLRQIWLGMMAYAGDNDDLLFTTASGGVPNHGQWTANARTSVLLAPDNSLAYWGLAYFPYIGGTRDVFRCPSAQAVDDWRESSTPLPSEFWLNSTYGLSGRVVGPSGQPTPLSGIANPATMIVAQDSAEQRFEGSDDSLGLFPGYTEILLQWRAGLTTLYPGVQFEWEWYRHDRRCNTLWLSGQVSSIPFTGVSVGIDYRYYTGETPERPLPGE